jgi:flavin reductase (DIM6/NTAB) family NADH-FMN oxidoreductase RutF
LTSGSRRPQLLEGAKLSFVSRWICVSKKRGKVPARAIRAKRPRQKGFAVITSKSAPSVIYSAVVSTIDTNRSPLLSAVVPVVIYGLRLRLDLPWQSTTASNLMRTGECVINLPSAETIATIERLAQTVTSINKTFDFSFSRAVVRGTLTPAHMTLAPSEAISALRALECPMQLEARIEGSIDTMDRERIVPLDKSVTFELNVLRVHVDSSVVLSDVRPNMWTPLMTCLREAYRTSPANPSVD